LLHDSGVHAAYLRSVVAVAIRLVSERVKRFGQVLAIDGGDFGSTVINRTGFKGFEPKFNRVVRDVECHAMRVQLRVKRPAFAMEKAGANDISRDAALSRN